MFHTTTPGSVILPVYLKYQEMPRTGTTILTSKSFYDFIAQDYNNQLISGQNDRIRKHIEQIFTTTVQGKNVLDFGGGTGLDLPWLTKHYSKVFFLEPSDKMRAMAKQSAGGHEVLFVENHLDFQHWSNGALPFSEKVNGLLANFAVLNCIQPIDVLFEKLAMIVAPGGYLIATVLDTRWHRIVKDNPWKIFTLPFTKGTATIYNDYKGYGHTTYLHPVRTLKDAASAHFHWENYLPVKGSPFALVILKRR